MKIVAFVFGFVIGYLLATGIFMTVVPFPPALVGFGFGSVVAIFA